MADFRCELLDPLPPDGRFFVTFPVDELRPEVLAAFPADADFFREVLFTDGLDDLDALRVVPFFFALDDVDRLATVHCLR